MTSDASPSTRILGNLRSEAGVGIVRIEDRYDTGIDDLWSAITDPDRLARWFGLVDGELSRGGEFRVHIADAGERIGQVKVCEPPQRVVVTTRETDESYRRGQGVPPFDADLGSHADRRRRPNHPDRRGQGHAPGQDRLLRGRVADPRRAPRRLHPRRSTRRHRGPMGRTPTSLSRTGGHHQLVSHLARASILSSEATDASGAAAW